MRAQQNRRWFHPRNLAQYANEELKKDLDTLLVEWGEYIEHLFVRQFTIIPRVLVNYNPPSRVSCTILPPYPLPPNQKECAWLKTVPKDDHLVRFALSSLPGCKAVMVSHLSWVHPKARGNGISPLLHEAKNRIAQDLRVGSLVCTVRGDNAAQHKVMQKVGWTMTGEFNSIKKDDLVRTYTKKVERKE